MYDQRIIFKFNLMQKLVEEVRLCFVSLLLVQVAVMQVKFNWSWTICIWLLVSYVLHNIGYSVWMMCNSTRCLCVSRLQKVFFQKTNRCWKNGGRLIFGTISCMSLLVSIVLNMWYFVCFSHKPSIQVSVSCMWYFVYWIGTTHRAHPAVYTENISFHFTFIAMLANNCTD